MTPVDEEALRSVLRERSDMPTIPPVPVDQLLAGGRQMIRVRRTRWAAGVGIGVAATVLAVVGAVALQSDTSRTHDPAHPSPSPSTPTQAPRALSDLPRGNLPAVPFTERNTLYTNRVSTDVEDGVLESIDRGYDAEADAWTVATVRRSGGVSSVDLVDSATGDKTAHVTDGVDGRIVVSADGRFVAWEDDDPDGSARVRLWDVASRTLAGSVTFPFTPTCCDNPFDVLGIDAHGELYGSGAGTVWVASVDGRSQPKVVHGLGAQDATIREVGANLLVVDTNGGPVRVGHLNDDRFVEKFTTTGQPGTVSWDEQRYAYIGGGTVRVLGPAGTETPMELPADVLPIGVPTWETTTAVLIQVQDTGEAPTEHAWVRCFVDDGGCELATMFADEMPGIPPR
jgi:hypothetical protein